MVPFLGKYRLGHSWQWRLLLYYTIVAGLLVEVKRKNSGERKEPPGLWLGWPCRIRSRSQRCMSLSC